MTAVSFDQEPQSNDIRRRIFAQKSRSRCATFTPTQSVPRVAACTIGLPKAAGLRICRSAVPAARNLGAQSLRLADCSGYLGWDDAGALTGDGFGEPVPLTAYNAITPLDADANLGRRRTFSAASGGRR